MSNDERTVIVCAPWSPWPIEHGLGFRAVAVMTAIAERGDRIILVLPSNSHPNHDDISASDLVAGYYQYIETSADRLFGRATYWMYRWARRRQPYWRPGATSVGLARFVSRVVDREKATAVVVLGSQLAWAAHDVMRHSRATVVIDFPDLLTANDRLWDDATRAEWESRADSVCELADRAETLCVRHCHHALIIASPEATRLGAISGGGTVNVAPSPLRNLRTLPAQERPLAALTVMGCNPFNVDGMLWLVEAVIPKVRTRIPDWELVVIGSVVTRLTAAAGLNLVGFVEDLEPRYRSARFTVCPVRLGTGQPSKVLDSLSRGIPVVAFPYAAERTPVRDGHNGLIVTSASEWVDAIVSLSLDDELHDRLAQGANATVVEEQLDNPMRRSLDTALGPQHPT